MTKGKGSYSKVSQVKKYKRFEGTTNEQTVSSHPRTTGYGYDRDELVKMHLARPIIDRAIDERIRANLISERKWVMSNGNAGDLEGIDDRVTSTKDLTPEQKIMVLNGILKRFGIKAEIVVAEPVEPTKPAPKTTTSKIIKKIVPYALLSRDEQAKVKEQKKIIVKKKKDKSAKKPSTDELSELAMMLEGI